VGYVFGVGLLGGWPARIMLPKGRVITPLFREHTTESPLQNLSL
jgi:hypothetical protein